MGESERTKEWSPHFVGHEIVSECEILNKMMNLWESLSSNVREFQKANQLALERVRLPGVHLSDTLLVPPFWHSPLCAFYQKGLNKKQVEVIH